MKTPIDWMKSPTTWMKAAETLMFSPNNWGNISTMKMTMMSLTVFLRRGALLDVPVRMAVAATCPSPVAEKFNVKDKDKINVPRG